MIFESLNINIGKKELAALVGVAGIAALASVFIPWEFIVLGLASVFIFYFFLVKIEQAFYLFIFYIPLHCVIFSEFVTKSAATSGTTFTLIGSVKDIFLVLLFISFLVNFLIGRIKIKKDPVIILILLFIFLCFFYLLFSPNLRAGVLELRNLTEFSAVYLLTIGILNNPQKVKKAIKYFLASAFLIILYALYTLLGSTIGYGYEFGVDPEHIVGRLTVFGDEKSTGAFSTYTSLVVIVSLCLILFFKQIDFKKTTKWSLLIIFLLSFVCMAFTFSRRAYLSLLLIALILLFLTKKKKIVLGITGALISTAVFVFSVFPETIRIFYERITIIDPQHTTNIGRIIELKMVLSRAFNNCFLGEGMGVSGSSGITFYFPEYIFSHNFYLSLLIQIGLLGVFIFLLITAIFLLRGLSRKIYKKISGLDKSLILGASFCVFALSFQSIFSLTIGVFPFNFYFWFFGGIATNLYNFYKKINN